MFYSVTAGSHSLPKDFRVIGPAATALHLLVIGGLIVTSWWREGEIALPDLPDPMPPLRVFLENHGSGGEVRRGSPSRKQPPGARDPRRLLAPVAMTRMIAVEADARIQAQDPNASRIGESGEEGDPLGRADGLAARAGGRETQNGDGGEGPFLPGGDVTAPQLLHRVEPLYPETARKLRREGVVTLEAIITAAGFVEEARVAGSADPLLDEAALRAVRQWRYRAGSLNGRPVPVILTVRVSFKLH